MRVLLARARAGVTPSPRPEHAAAFAQVLADQVPSAPARSSVRRTTAVRRSVVSAAIAAALAAMAGTTAMAADGAAPGDALFGLDLALESAGILDGGYDERMGEANELMDEGDLDGAAEATVLALREVDNEAADALEALADEALSGDGTGAARVELGELLRFAGGADRGEVMVDGVMVRVRDLANVMGQERAGDTPGLTGDNPGQSGEAPGNSGNAPGQSGEAPRNSDNAPAQPTQAPDQPGNAPDDPGDAPGGSGNAPEQPGQAPDNSGSAPGRPGQPTAAPGNSGNAGGKPSDSPGR